MQNLVLRLKVNTVSSRGTKIHPSHPACALWSRLKRESLFFTKREWLAFTQVMSDRSVPSTHCVNSRATAVIQEGIMNHSALCFHKNIFLPPWRRWYNELKGSLWKTITAKQRQIVILILFLTPQITWLSFQMLQISWLATRQCM